MPTASMLPHRVAKFGRAMQIVCLSLLTGAALVTGEPCPHARQAFACRAPMTVEELQQRNVDLSPSRATLYRWKAHYNNWGEVPADTDAYKLRTACRRTAFKHKRVHDTVREAKKIVLEHPEYYLDEIRDHVYKPSKATCACRSMQTTRKGASGRMRTSKA